MSESEERPVVTEADVTPRNVERRTFLGRFGVAVGLAGVAAFAQACGGGEASDADSSDADGAGAASPDSAATGATGSDADASDSDSN